jgi:hypothetical protein
MVKSLRGMPHPKDVKRCVGRTKVCANCGFEFPKKDMTWFCPKCKAERRCRQRAEPGKMYCLTHARGRRRNPPADAKYYISQEIREVYNALLKRPDLVRLSHEIAVLGARNEQLFRMMDEHDTRAAHSRILQSAELIEQSVMDDDKKGTRVGLDMLRRALDPVRLQWILWGEIKENMELVRRMSDTERRFVFLDQEAIPVAMVVEALAFTTRVMLKYIREPMDRANASRELRAGLTPIQPRNAIINANPSDMQRAA